MLAPYPAARVPLERWAEHNGCKASVPQPNALDFDRSLDGNEATQETWSDCAAPVELWTVRGGGHGLPLARGATERILQFLEAAGRKP